MKTYSEALKVIIETGKSYNNYYIYFLYNVNNF